MLGRTFAAGDIHEDLDGLARLLSCLPELTTAEPLTAKLIGAAMPPEGDGGEP